MRVKWNPQPRADFRAAVRYIKERSEQNAEMVFQKTVAAVNSLSHFPFRHRADPLRLANDGSYRYFIIYHYRISYHVGDDEIRIVRFRHTSQQPEFY